MIEFITKARFGWSANKDPHPGYIAVDMSKWLPKCDHNMPFAEYCEKYEVVELRDMSYLEWRNKDKPKSKKKKVKKSATKKTVAKVEPKNIEVPDEPEGERYEIYVLEFDWDYGYEREEVESIKDARVRRKQWEETFTKFTFTNWKLSKEIRYRKKLEF